MPKRIWEKTLQVKGYPKMGIFIFSLSAGSRIIFWDKEAGSNVGLEEGKCLGLSDQINE